jgi:hypothetical protein
MENEHRIYVYNFITHECEYEMDMHCKMNSVEISANSRYLLIHRTDGEARMIDLETQELVRTFRGDKGGNYIVKASFGGANESFVVVGSEGVQISYYSRGLLLTSL